MGTRGKGRKVDQGANFHRVAVSRRKNCGNLDKADEWKCEIFLESAACARDYNGVMSSSKEAGG